MFSVIKKIVQHQHALNQKECIRNISNVFIVDAHFTSNVLTSLNDEQSMEVISALNLSACYKHTFTIQAKLHMTITPHIITKHIHAFIPPFTCCWCKKYGLRPRCHQTPFRWTLCNWYLPLKAKVAINPPMRRIKCRRI